jgi:alginate O-acetyltransferase complex protein AlgI
MTFTTLTFLIFFVAVFALYWSLRNRMAQNVLLVIASYVFYGWWDWRFCWLMLASSLLDYFVGLGLDRGTNERKRKWLLALGMCGNLSMLCYFKYFNFFAENLQIAAASVGWNLDVPTLRFVLPVGISFYTFQTMSYSIDIYRRQLPATRNLIDYLAYVSFFPQLVAGPIERGIHLLPQFGRERRFNYDMATDGCRQMMWGFLKKMIVADNLAPLVDRAFSTPAACSGAELLAATLFFAVQIYCDFSAYSEIASGTARLFGFDLMRNFSTPYFSTSMREFWRRWHISLSTWFRDYVYLSLGGGRVSRPRKVFNVMTTFLLSGFWHGATWNFVAWGALHGLAVLPEMLSAPSVEPRPARHAVVRAAQMLAVFVVVCVGWILFRAANLRDASLILQEIVPLLVQIDTWFTVVLYADRGPMGRALLVAIVLMFAVEWMQRDKPHALHLKEWPTPARWAVYLSGTALLLFYGTFSTSSFIYFQF